MKRCKYFPELLSLFSHRLFCMALSRREIESLASKTIGQQKNSYWVRLRQKRLTASAFGRVVRLIQTQNLSAIQKFKQDFLCSARSDGVGNDLSKITAVRWGLDHEARAIKQYGKITSQNVSSTGLWLFPE